MGLAALVEPQVILERPLITFDVIAEDIRRRIIPPLNGVASPNLVWDVQGTTSLRRNYGD